MYFLNDLPKLWYKENQIFFTLYHSHFPDLTLKKCKIDVSLYHGDKIKESVMGEACSIHERDKVHQKFKLKNMKK
jgi:hypothetical protein